MKQQITHKQLNELSPKAFDWFVTNYWPEGRLERTNQDLEPEDFTIGQMIEFLMEFDVCRTENSYIDEHFDHVFSAGNWRENTWNINIGWNGQKEICDALWEAVKEVLEK